MGYNKETEMYEGYIYLITNLINNKKYIGQTIQTINRRYTQHLANAFKYNKNTHLYQAMRKHGKDNFKIEIIEIISRKSKEELSKDIFKLETEYILKFDTFKNGYNLTTGDKGLGTSMDKKVYQYDIDSGLLINKFNSLEQALIKTGVTSISQTCNGRQISAGGYLWSYDLYDVHPNAGYRQQRFSIKIDQYNLNREFIATYDSMAEAEEKYGIKNICNALNGKYKSVGGYLWCKHGEEPPYPSTYSKGVDQYDMQGNFVCSYDTSIDAERKTGISYVGIIKCCKGKINHMGYYVWRYKGDSYNKFEIKIKYKKINCYTEDGVFVKTFDSVNLAIKFIGVKYQTLISDCLKGKRDSAYGYKWFYIDDENQFDKSRILKYKTN